MKNKRLLHLAWLLLSASSLAAQIPIITSFSPESGNVGTLINITGANFSIDPALNLVNFGATRGVVTSASPTQLDVIVPIGATYDPITVTVNGLMASTAKPFVVTFSGSAGSFGNRIDLWAGFQVKWSAVADVDGDGKTDLLAVDEAWNMLHVWRNTSTTGSLSWDSFSYMLSFPTSASPYALEVEDLDGNGLPEIVVTNNNGSVGIFENNSAPGYISFGPQLDFETMATPLFISIRDLDNDGRQDIAVACANNFGTGAVSVLRNTSTIGSLSFEPHVDFEVGTGGVWCVKLQDMDQDGKPDMLVTSGGSAWLSVFRNIAVAGAIDNGSFAERIDFATGAYPSIMAISDFDSDGKPDVVVGNAAGNSMSIFRNSSSAGNIDATSFQAELIFSADPWNPTAGDVDGDGKLEIIVRNSSGDLVVYKNSSTPGTFTFAPSSMGIGGAPLGINVVDLDGDEKADLVVSNEAYNVITIFQNISLDPPNALPATFVSNTGFEAQWNGVDNVFEYSVDVSPSEDFSIPIEGYTDLHVWGSPWEINHMTIAGLQADTDYYYRVRAIGNGTPSANSATIATHTNPSPALASSNIWAKQFNGWGDDEIQSMTSDKFGNVYIAGHYTGSLTLGSTTLNSLGEYDIFLAQLDPNGNVKWVVSIGGEHYDNEVSIAVDEKGLYLTAQYSGDIDVDPGSGNMIFSNEGLPYVNDGFFARYNVDNGALVWARHLPDAAGWSSSSIGIDKTGVYLTGHFMGAVDFNPGPGVHILNSSGDEDIFLAKYTLDGNFVWAGNMGGWGRDTAWGLLVDGTGVYVHGSYSFAADFDPTSGETILYDAGGFFARYDSGDGSLRYVKSVGNGTIYAVSRFGRSLFIAGDFYGVIDADPGDGSYYIGQEGYYNANALIGNYDLHDGKFRWAGAMLTTGFIGARKIISEPSGIYVSGYFGGSVDFDPGTEEANRSSVQVDAFSAKYSRDDGSLLWAKGMGSPGRAVSITATMTNSGYYLAGLFGETVDFNPYTGSVVMTSTGGTNDIFIAKYQRSHMDSMVSVKATHINEKVEVTKGQHGEIPIGIQLYPNPAAQTLNIDLQGFESGPVEVTTRDLFGRLMITRTQTSNKEALNISRLKSGVYILQARQGNRLITVRFIKE